MYVALLILISLYACAMLFALRLVMSQKAMTWQRRIYALIVLGLMCCSVFSMAGWLIGGAISSNYGGYTYLGKIENGQHFLGDRGTYKAVSKEDWLYLKKVEAVFGEKWHAVGFASLVAAFLLGAFTESFLGPPPPPDTELCDDAPEEEELA
ncbi:hypothetical protein NA78x_004919 [Anatilimnocola sp. NA78]|uniref:hypothetical protein n=1 Tax=Anatilimnocola sp. NA78 TaxID=3415683 RepID=UPI003CE54A22